MSTTCLTLLSANAVAQKLCDLGAVLHACVHAGASINFVLPFSMDDAHAFWAGKVLPAVQRGTRFVLIAEADGQLAGSVQLSIDTPPNQPHRGEVAKLIVHPGYRRRGIARALMTGLEALALKQGRTLLTLDTRTGDSAEPLYADLGYVTIGAIPGYSCDPFDTSRLDSTTFMYKTL